MMKRGSNTIRSILFLLACLAVLVIVWLLFLPDYSKASGASQCTPAPLASGAPTNVKDVAPVPLILEKPEGVVLAFDRDRGAHSRTVYLQAAKKTAPKSAKRYATLIPETVLGVSPRPLERQELQGNIGTLGYVASAVVTDRKEVSLQVCLDASAADLDPGTYVGSVRLEGGGIQPVTVPVEVTLQYDGYRWMVPVLGVATFLAGSFVVWAAHKRAKQEGQARTSIWGDIAELPGWIADNYVGVAGGAIATVSVFVARYWRVPAWGARAPEDWFALLGAMFTAYTTTLTAATAVVTPRTRARSASADDDKEEASPDLTPETA